MSFDLPSTDWFVFGFVGAGVVAAVLPIVFGGLYRFFFPALVYDIEQVEGGFQMFAWLRKKGHLSEYVMPVQRFVARVMFGVLLVARIAFLLAWPVMIFGAFANA